MKMNAQFSHFLKKEYSKKGIAFLFTSKIKKYHSKYKNDFTT